jgi:hypothetical protein
MSGAAPARGVGGATQSQRRAWLIAAVFAAVGLLAVWSGQFLTNEGVLTWILAGLMSQAPLDMLFFLKGRPPISIFYAPAAAIGLTPFAYVHMLVAALAIPLTAAVARRFGHPRPALPALLLALSPLYFAGAASGVQNTDATVGLLLVVWLVTCQRPLTAGVVMSLVLLGRIETAVFAVALIGYAIATPGARRLLLGLVILPTIYVAAGALYHGSLLWPLRYPSSVFNPAMLVRGGSLDDLVTGLLTLSPVLGVLCWAPLRTPARLETVLWIASLAFIVAIRGLPFTQLIYFDASPRFLLPALPFLCLAMGRAIERWGRSRLATVGGALLLVAAVLVTYPWVEPWVAAVLTASAAACVLAAGVALASPRAARGSLLASAAALSLFAAVAPSSISLMRTTHLQLGDDAHDLADCARWIETTVPPGAVVVTDQHLLRVWMAAHTPRIHADVRHLVQADMLFEARALTNPATPQFEEIFHTARFYYAPWIFREELAALPGPVYVLMRTDSPNRLPSLEEPPFDRIDWLTERPRWRGGRLRRDAQ